MASYGTFQWRVMFVASMVLQQNAEAGVTTDRDRVVINYTTNADPCFKISPDSHVEAKHAANKACKDAFFALDRLEGNSCSGWRRPECRQLRLPDHDYFECSCKISTCNYLGVKSVHYTSFRDCAWKIYTEEIFDGQTAAPSDTFRRTFKRVNQDAIEMARLRRLASSGSVAGSSQTYKRQRTEGTFSGAVSSQGEGTSQDLEVPYIADPSLSAGYLVHPIIESDEPYEPYVCDVCEHPYTTQGILNEHKKSHLSDIRCNICPNKKFSTPGNLTAHMNKFHSNPAADEPGSSSNPVNLDDPGTSQPSTDRPHICEVCGKGYKLKNSLSAHRRVHKENVRCDKCNWDFANVSNYRYHMGHFHPKAAAAEEAELERQRLERKRFVCAQCHSRFTSHKRLREHLPVHRGETHCHQCNRTFPRKSLLNSHNKAEHS